MRLLILGYSSIAERRVIPAAAKVAAIGETRALPGVVMVVAHRLHQLIFRPLNQI